MRSQILSFESETGIRATGQTHPETQALIDGMVELVCLVDSSGMIQTTNENWRRQVKRNGVSGFDAGDNYLASVTALIEAGDARLQPVLAGFNQVRSGQRQSFRCIYLGAGILAGQDYDSRFSAVVTNGRRLVLISAVDLSRMNALKRQRRRLGSQVLHAQEHERRRMARELHDSTAQSLVVLQLNLAQLSRSVAGQRAGDLIADINQTVEQVQREIRSFSFLAHPPTLAHDLAGALEALTKGFAARTELTIDLHLSDVGEASEPVETAVYRLTQEALANIQRHAGASHVSVRLVGTMRCLHLMIIDDGIGFDEDQMPTRRPMGVGIVGMRERINDLGGRFSIHKAGKGTVVSTSVPRGIAAP